MVAFQTRDTRLVVTEGYTEKVTVSYLYTRFKIPQVYVHAEDAHGGSPRKIINHAVKFAKARSYQKKYIYMDSDKKIGDNDKEKAKTNNFKFIFNDKCLEAIFLKLLKPNINWSNQPTELCRRKIKTHLGGLNQTTITTFLDKYSNSNLKNNPTLKQIIDIIQKA